MQQEGLHMELWGNNQPSFCKIVSINANHISNAYTNAYSYTDEPVYGAHEPYMTAHNIAIIFSSDLHNRPWLIM